MAAVYLSIIALPVVNTLVSGRAFTMHGGEKRMALALAERKTEQLIKAGYGSIGSDTDVSSICMTPGSHPTDPAIVVATHGDASAANDLLGEMTWEVTPVTWPSPGDSVRMKIVEVKVRWPQAAPRDSVIVATMVGA